jgi:hypothetical protein
LFFYITVSKPFFRKANIFIGNLKPWIGALLKMKKTSFVLVFILMYFNVFSQTKSQDTLKQQKKN